MLVYKSFAVIFVLCFVHGCAAKPTTDNTHELTEGRGIMSSIWGWITYPFTWWSSGELEQPVTEHLVASTVPPTESVEIRKLSVTIWCNDQTCTTMKCNKTECRNVTCNLYDTDLHGECREYNISETSEEFTVPKPTEEASVSATIVDTEKTNETTTVTSKQEDTVTPEEHPLELEAVLSSTVQEDNVEKQQSE